MSWGFLSENESGRVQIDQDYPNMLVVGTGTCTQGEIIDFPPGVVANNVQIWARINAASRNTVCAFDGTSNFRITGHIDRDTDYNGPQNRFRIMAGHWFDYQSGSGGQLWNYFYENHSGSSRDYSNSPSNLDAAVDGTLIDYVVCTQPEILTPPTTGYGLNVFKASQELAYSSEYQVMNVVEDARFDLDYGFNVGGGAADSDRIFPVELTNQPADRYVLINSTYAFHTQTVAFPGMAIYFSPNYQINYTNNTITYKYSQYQSGPAMGRSFFFINFNSGKQRRHMMLGDLSN